jgi:hypothetical protein
MKTPFAMRQNLSQSLGASELQRDRETAQGVLFTVVSRRELQRRNACSQRLHKILSVLLKG